MDASQETKRCTRCGMTQPLTEYYIKDRTTGRRHARCKACHNAITLGRYHATKVLHPKVPAPVVTAKVCTCCGQTKDVTDFNWKTRAQGRRRAVCRSCQHEANTAYRQAHQDTVKASRARYYAERRAELAERQRAWREANPDADRKIHRGWKQRNPDQVLAQTHKRRNQLRGAGGAFTGAEWNALKALYDHRCLMCGRQEPNIMLTIDHVVPISEGGTNTIANLQPLCKSCNSKKHRRVLDLRNRKDDEA